MGFLQTTVEDNNETRTVNFTLSLINFDSWSASQQLIGLVQLPYRTTPSDPEDL